MGLSTSISFCWVSSFLRFADFLIAFRIYMTIVGQHGFPRDIPHCGITAIEAKTAKSHASVQNSLELTENRCSSKAVGHLYRLLGLIIHHDQDDADAAS